MGTEIKKRGMKKTLPALQGMRAAAPAAVSSGFAAA
jgi:hypothetical protein